MITSQQFDWRRNDGESRIWFGYRLHDDGTERCVGLVLDRGSRGASSRLNRVDVPKHHNSLAEAKARVERDYI